MALLCKLVAATFDEGIGSDDLTCTVRLQTSDGRSLESISSRATAAAATTLWSEELLLPVQPMSAASAAALAFELHSASRGLVAAASRPWRPLAADAGEGCALRAALHAPGTKGAQAAPVGQLYVRLLLLDALREGAALEQLKCALADANATNAELADCARAPPRHCEATMECAARAAAIGQGSAAGR